MPEPDVKLEALLLHLDEALTNGFDGHDLERCGARDVAFWTQFYSLFYDKVYVPANFLLDSNETVDFLQALRVDQEDSVLRSPQCPFRILWDKNRFTAPTFQKLAADNDSEAKSELLVTRRDPKHYHDAAEVLDKYGMNREPMSLRIDMTWKADAKASMEKLRHEYFDSERNSAMPEALVSPLQRCLERIEKRGDEVWDRGYGRNIYYAIWGYGDNAATRAIGREFEHITGDSEFRSLKNRFPTAVDVASHTLKAEFASNDLRKSQPGREIGVVIPSQYVEFVRPRQNTVVETRLEPREKHLLYRESIVEMTAAQLETLHKSDEYAKLRELLGTMARLRNASQRPDDVAIGEVRQAFNLYLSRISRVLDPGPYNKDFGLEVICHVLPTVAGIATFVGDGGSVTSLLRGMMATISTYDFLHKKLEKVLQSHRSKDNLEIKADFYLTGDFLAET